jgi:predicted nucleic acid-binding protein
VELVEVDVRTALELAVRFDIYAYDAYFILCALQLRCPLLTLDKGMRQVAKRLNVNLMEQP